MALRLGTWSVNVNGAQGELILQSIGAQGAVSGQIFGLILRGIWNEGAQTITFLAQRYGTPVPDGCPQHPLTNIPHTYKGYLFSTPPMPEPGQDILWTLTGFVVDALGEPENGVSGTARRNEFGWFAQITEVV